MSRVCHGLVPSWCDNGIYDAAPSRELSLYEFNSAKV